MASSEDLVPTGLPHGQRQNVEAGMRMAGLPHGSTSGGGGTLPQTPARSSGGQPPARSTNAAAPTDPLKTLDAQMFQPVAAPATYEQRIESIATKTTNPFLRLAAGRILAKR